MSTASGCRAPRFPATRPGYGSFYVLAEEAERAVRDIIVESQAADPGTEARKVGDLYASFLDEARVQELGAAPIAGLLAEAAAVTSIDSLLATLGKLERGGSSGFVQVFVDNDPGQPDRYLVFMEQGGLGLPDESYYREEKSAAIRAKYVEYVERMFTLAGLDDAAARAARVFELETELASHHWDNVATRDSEKSYNPMPWSAADELLGAIDLDLWLTAMGVPDGCSTRSSCASRASSRVSRRCSWPRISTSGKTGCRGRSSARTRHTCPTSSSPPISTSTVRR